MKFQTFNLHAQVTAGITAAGYVTPTPIQVQAIPPVLEGSDVMGLAQTGTGKTAAFALPILQRLIEEPGAGPLALIDGAPTAGDIALAARIVARYGQGRDAEVVTIAVHHLDGLVEELAVTPLAVHEMPSAWHV